MCGYQESQDEKRCEIKDGSQEMVLIVDKWQRFITTIQVKLCN